MNTERVTSLCVTHGWKKNKIWLSSAIWSVVERRESATFDSQLVAQGWSQCCVWQTSLGWSPTLYKKACNFNVSRYYSTGTRDHLFTWLSICHSPTVMSAHLGHNERGRENWFYLADSLAHKAIKQSLPLAHCWLYCLWHLQ